MGDQATNIAENLRYLITGPTMTDPRPKHGTPSLTSVADKEIR